MSFPLLWVVEGMIPPVFYLILDDFLVVGSDCVCLDAATWAVVSVLSLAGFIFSNKSRLTPTQRIFFIGKWVDLVDRSIRSHERAMLQMFDSWLHLATGIRPPSRLLAKALGCINWHPRARLGGGLFLAGSFCCDR